MSSAGFSPYQKFSSWISKTENRFKWALILPTIVLLALITVYPTIYALRLALSDYNLARAAESLKGYIGLANFREILRDVTFWSSLRTTVVFTVVVVAVEFFLGLVIALILQGAVTRSKIVRTLILLPMIMAPIVVGLTWTYLYQSEFGLVTYILRKLHLMSYRTAPLADVRTALPALMIVDIWQWTPFLIMVLLAGLEALPTAPYEAARIDKAPPFLVFRKITLPLLKPVILIVLVLRIMDAIRVFDIVYALTEGGPGEATDVLSMFIYRNSFYLWNIGKASAISFILLYIIMIISVILVNVLSRVKETV
ncbi:MAG: sugar ABC transporter permease [Candidatus Atribacteria bacterium]|nr:sugar ABC transporter permease [Candidatus Atribacteria bacterium]